MKQALLLVRTKSILIVVVFHFTSSFTNAQSWSLTGNTGTSPSTDFIGSTDNKSLFFRTNNTQRMVLDNLGNIGLGITTPAEKIHIDGKIRFGTTSKVTMNSITDGTNTNITFSGADHGLAFVNAARFGGGVYSATDQYIDLRGNGISIKSYRTYTTEGALDLNTTTNITTAGYKLFTVKNQNIMKSYIDKDGGAWFNSAVGIGTTNTADANYKLFVETGIRTRKIKVDQTAWADYVFQPEYKLRPLSDVETFIRKNNHLPEVPSAKEVKQNGVDLGENQVLLLKKIEELTLYVIEQNKKLEEQGKMIEKLKAQMKKK
jgi:hypothetical protein